MKLPQRLRDWIVGKQEFRALVEVDPTLGSTLCGRRVRGSTAVEVDHVAYGPRGQARLDAVAQLRSRLEVEAPGAQLLALLDGPPPRSPEPVLRLAKGRRPRLLLVGEDAGADPSHLMDRVSRIWGLPVGWYQAPRVPDPFDRRPLVALVVVGFVLALPLMTAMFLDGPLGQGELLSPRLWRTGVPGGAGLGASVALALSVLIMARRRRWSGDRTWRTVLLPLLPSLAVGIVALLVDSVTFVGQRYRWSWYLLSLCSA